jgi:hypothetical protein
MERMIWTLAIALAACSDTPPANVAGTYTVNITDEANGCNLQNWQQGNQTTGIPVAVTQTGSTAQAIVQGASGAYVNLVIGGSTFDGSVSGPHLDAALHGTRAYTMANCTYTFTATLDATLAKDTLSGTITYTPATNGSPDCGTLASCSSVQNFNGLRPPT